MRIARLGTTLITVSLLFGVAAPAQAATTTISIVSVTQGFSPDPVSRAQGTTFAWHNSDSITETA